MLSGLRWPTGGMYYISLSEAEAGPANLAQSCCHAMPCMCTNFWGQPQLCTVHGVYHLLFCLRMHACLTVRMCLSAARGLDDSTIQLWVESLFMFSVVWSVGATGDTDGREAFDSFFRYVHCNSLQRHNPARPCDLLQDSCLACNTLTSFHACCLH